MEGERINQLLQDKSPSVRTAVLRQLAEHPQDAAIQSLIDYLSRETDEDLLVYATKTLGQIGDQAGLPGRLWRSWHRMVASVPQRLDAITGSLGVTGT
ncbi:MAG: HEAT repeat domain-containing protein [Pirellulaceae bacterium]